MSLLLGDGSEGEYVVNILMGRYETIMSPNFNMSPLNIYTNFHIENYGIELREFVTHHDHPIVVHIWIGSQFVD